MVLFMLILWIWGGWKPSFKKRLPAESLICRFMLALINQGNKLGLF
jgi:hypothetical protein